MAKVGVIGAGAWGSALAQVQASKGKDVLLWARDDHLVQQLHKTHQNEIYLPGISLSPYIKATSDLQVVAQAQLLLIVTPAQAVRETLKALKSHIRGDHALVLCAKGIELETGLLMSDVLQEILPGTGFAVLTGPNFAAEIAKGQPAATTLACADKALAERLQQEIATKYFRPYTSDDLVGAQLAGALKNVIAIACGIAHGMGMGESSRASLVTRGMAEIVRLAVAMGARRETFLGLSGMGDMMLTCSSMQSRNFSLGAALGKGESLEKILKARKSVTEGVHTARAAIALAQKHKAELPVCQAVHSCLSEGVGVDVAIKEMLNRPLGTEI